MSRVWKGAKRVEQNARNLRHAVGACRVGPQPRISFVALPETNAHSIFQADLYRMISLLLVNR